MLEKGTTILFLGILLLLFSCEDGNVSDTRKLKPIGSLFHKNQLDTLRKMNNLKDSLMFADLNLIYASLKRKDSLGLELLEKSSTLKEGLSQVRWYLEYVIEREVKYHDINWEEISSNVKFFKGVKKEYLIESLNGSNISHQLNLLDKHWKDYIYSLIEHTKYLDIEKFVTDMFQKSIIYKNGNQRLLFIENDIDSLIGFVFVQEGELYKTFKVCNDSLGLASVLDEELLERTMDDPDIEREQSASFGICDFVHTSKSDTIYFGVEEPSKNRVIISYLSKNIKGIKSGDIFRRVDIGE